MTEKKQLICINCAISCHLTVEMENEKVAGISDNRCNRGIDYALQEAVKPLRIFTGLMRTDADRPLSVRSDRPVPKSLLLSCAAELRRCRPVEPVESGTVILSDICGTGADIVATRTLPEPDCQMPPP